MTVGELIKALQEFEENTPVLIHTPYYGVAWGVVESLEEDYTEEYEDEEREENK